MPTEAEKYITDSVLLENFRRVNPQGGMAPGGTGFLRGIAGNFSDISNRVTNFLNQSRSRKDNNQANFEYGAIPVIPYEDTFKGRFIQPIFDFAGNLGEKFRENQRLRKEYQEENTGFYPGAPQSVREQQRRRDMGF